MFTKPANGWTSTSSFAAKLTTSDAAFGDEFGYSVAVDGGTVVVGAAQDDDDGADTGSASLYEVSDWTVVPDSAVGGANSTSYTVTGLTNDAEYNFRIRATNGVDTGSTSDAVTVILAMPSKPTGLAATSGNTQTALTWDDPSVSAVTGYEYLQAQTAKLTAYDGATADSLGGR